MPSWRKANPIKCLVKACKQLCEEFPEVFKPELSCLRDYELEVAFKPDAKLVLCEPWTVPFALLEDLNTAYDTGIKKGIWVPTQFNKYGTPVMPI